MNPIQSEAHATEPTRSTKRQAALLRQLAAARPGARSGPADPGTLRTALARELELREPALLERLLALGITDQTAPAFEALPLVEVAWADGGVDPEERWRVLEGATRFGLELGRPAHAQLELWLEHPPSGELFDAWYAFAARVLARRRQASRARCVREGVAAVAAAAGGILGFGAVSVAERAVIERVGHALTPAPRIASHSDEGARR